MDPLKEKIETLETGVAQYRDGGLKEADFRKLRLANGISGSRNGTYGLRLHIPLGAILPADFFSLVEAAERFGDGGIRIFPRQGIEFLGVPLGRLVALYRFLAKRMPHVLPEEATSLEGAQCCPRSGLCQYQAFDIRDWIAKEKGKAPEDSSGTGRGPKLAISGCGNDCGLATLSDLGLIASLKEGREGFRVYTHPRPGVPRPRSLKLYDWVPSESVSNLIHCIETIHAELDGGQDSLSGGVSALAESIGLGKFRALVESRLGKEAGEFVAPVEPGGPAQPRKTACLPPPDEWVFSKFQVCRQNQDEMFSLGITPPLGILERENLRKLVDTLVELPSVSIRIGVRRDMYLGDIPGPRLSWVVKSLLPTGMLGKTEGLSHVLTCPGPESCSAALCNAPGLTKSLIEEIKTDEGLSKLRNIPISVGGCPTNCSRHLSAAIGFSGSLRYLLGKPAPCYDVWLGGTVREGHTRPALHIGKLLAIQVIPWLKEFMGPVVEGGDAFLEYVHEKGGLQRGAELVRRFTAEAARSGISYNVFIDIGMAAPFSPAYSVKSRAEGYRRDPATHHLERANALRRRLPELTGELEREAVLAAVFRESCLALAHILGIGGGTAQNEVPIEALERALASAGTEPAAEGLSILDAAQRNGKNLEPYRKEILFLNYHVEKLFQSARPGRIKDA